MLQSAKVNSAHIANDSLLRQNRGVALATMGEQLTALVDVTIVCPVGAPRFWDLLCGDPVLDKACRRV